MAKLRTARRLRVGWVALVTLVALGLWALVPFSAQAAGIVVDSTDDTAIAGDDACTLREAIENANADTDTTGGDCVAGDGADTITFSVSGTIVLGSELPAITDVDGLVIDGSGQDVTISGNNAVRPFVVDVGASLTLRNLTVADGDADFEDGGGIFNSGTLVLENTTLSANEGARGGGIFNDGTLTLASSTLSGNSAGFGGGISNSGTLTVVNSTLSANSASRDGGGINNSGTVTVTNSTLSDNSALNVGGSLLNSGTLTVTNTIVANSPSGGDCSGTGTSNDGGNNLIEDGSCGLSAFPADTDPRLAPLADNGGPTWTHALLYGSPAIDAGSNAVCAAAPIDNLDQRGQPRPLDGNADGTATCDIGAYEAAAPPTNVSFIVDSTADDDDVLVGDTSCATALGECTLRAAIQEANALPGAQTITFSVSGTIVLASELPLVTDPAGLVIDGSGQTVTVSGNNAVTVFLVDVDGSLTLRNLSVADAAEAGAVFNTGTLSIENSTLSGNSAGALGGGILNFNSGTVMVTNSTLSDNSAVGAGGGIFNDGTLTLTNSTLSSNSAVFGGGIANRGTLTVVNSIIANSPGGGDCLNDVGGTVNDGGNNLVEDGSCGLSAFPDGTDPLLAPLADNGGPTWTHALQPDSPAVDAGSNVGCPGTDQRGEPRPRQGKGSGSLTCDIGAYEKQANTPPTAVGVAYTTNQDTPLVVGAAQGVLANDTDAEGDPLSALPEAGPSNGSLSLNADGSFTYTPNTGFSGTDSFTYRAGDGLDPSAPASVTITVTAVDPPAPPAAPDPSPANTGSAGPPPPEDPRVTAPADQQATAGVPHSVVLGSFTDAAGDGPWSVRVDWGDGSDADSFMVDDQPRVLGARLHTYSQPGDYIVEVQVRDRHGGTGRDSFAVLVRPAPAPPAEDEDADLEPVEPVDVEPEVFALPPAGPPPGLPCVTNHQPPLGTEQYFAETGFRVDPLFWEYFQDRGGVVTFGYPISRSFTWGGCTVQLFQRGVVRICPDGGISVMNLLDSGLFPFTRAYGSTFPSADHQLETHIPQIDDVDYDSRMADFLREHVPDVWSGQAVDFWQAFLGAAGSMTEPLDDPALLALEVWGPPISTPASDPNNPNFVYQLFQRAILHCDGTTGLTQPMLVGDFVKALWTGHNLPSDLLEDAAAQGSPYLHIHCPDMPRGLCDPERFPDMDLSHAFEPE